MSSYNNKIMPKSKKSKVDMPTVITVRRGTARTKIVSYILMNLAL